MVRVIKYKFCEVLDHFLNWYKYKIFIRWYVKFPKIYLKINLSILDMFQWISFEKIMGENFMPK